MDLSRRAFLRIGGLTVVSTATGCQVIGRQLAKGEMPEALQIDLSAGPNQAAGQSISEMARIKRLLNRAGYGGRPGDMERVQQMGYGPYLEAQLHPEGIDDRAADLMLRNMSLYHMDVSQLVAQEPKDAAAELISSTVLRALYSKRQLYEAMVEFWSDHFNIYIRKNQRMPLLKLIDDRDVIRPNALGNFRDLLFASARSPAMLVYLDNVQNGKGEPNENYSRELMELHTLGVDGGYAQQDVAELARVLTGLSVARRGRRRGQFIFDDERHDAGEKLLLGHRLRAGQGQDEVNEALEILVTHPSTAKYIARKLVRRFVADDPPAALIDRVAQEFQSTDGEIKAMLRLIFNSEEFAQAPPKLKRPFTYLISCLRVLHADVAPSRELGRWLQQLGQPLFLWPPPNGYPDVSSAWTSTLLPRWNLAIAIAHEQLPRTTIPLARLAAAAGIKKVEEVVDMFSELILGGQPDSQTRELLTAHVGPGDLQDRATRQQLRDSLALMLASPAFQWS